MKKTNNIPPEADLIPISEYAKTFISRRGFPVTVQYIYQLITQYKDGSRDSLPFEFQEIGKQIWIKK